MNELLDRAEIEVDFEDVRLGDELLSDLGPVEMSAPEQLVVEVDVEVEETEVLAAG
jgi:hypothetical protein